VGKVQPVSTQPGTVDVTLKVFDGLTTKSLDQVAIDGCKGDCAAPIVSGVSDATGTAVVSVPYGAQGFDAYVRSTKPDYLPTYSYQLPPFVPVASKPYVIVQYPKAAIDVVAQAVGITLDPTKGLVAATIFDCAGNPLGEAIVEIAGAENVYYTEKDVVSKTARSTQAGNGAGAGLANGFNVTPGDVLVTAKAAGGTVVAKGTVRVSPAAITRLYLSPTP
jgi:hypothetical protein